MTYATDSAAQHAEHNAAVLAEHEPNDDTVRIGGLLYDADDVPDRSDA